MEPRLYDDDDDVDDEARCYLC